MFGLVLYEPSDSCGEGFFSSDEGFDSIDHVLDEFFLGSSESSSVGDIEDSIVSLGVLSVNSSDLDEVLVGDFLELPFLLHQEGELDVDRCSEGSSEVGGAGGDVSEVVIVSEHADFLDLLGGSAESVEDGDNSGSLLHGDDSELILLVDPDEESLGGVVEDTSAGRPVSVEVAGLEESVTLSIFK